MKGLKDNDSIIIKQANKGGSLVTQDRSDYEKEAYRLLSDNSAYGKLHGVPLPGFQVELTSLVDEATKDDVLDKREKLFLLPSMCSSPYFYHLPKIHKFTVCPSGRPIVASMKSFTAGLSY